MITSETDICNLAIGWLGGNLITSIEDESDEARLCKANFDSCRDTALESRDWSFATARRALNPSADVPPFQWSSQFTLPSDCLKLREVHGNTEMTDYMWWAKEGNMILCDQSVVYIIYTQRIVDPVRFSPNFTQALASLIASNIAVPLTDSAKLMDLHFNSYVGKVHLSGALDGQQGRNIPLRSTILTRVRFSNSGPIMPY